MGMETLFTKIGKGEIPSVKLYEDDICFVILDINPVVKGHALVISREPYPNMANCPDDVLAHLIQVAKRVDLKQREALKSEGSNIFINNDPASGQEVPHIHVHVVPRYANDGRKYFALHDNMKTEKYKSLERNLRFELWQIVLIAIILFLNRFQEPQNARHAHVLCTVANAVPSTALKLTMAAEKA